LTDVGRALRNQWVAVVGLVILLAVAVCVAFPSLLTSYTVDEQVGGRLAGPSADHWFGTDSLRRDLFARVLYGGRVSLAVGLAVAFMTTVIGVTVGAVAGYRGGRLDDLLMRTTDLFLALPTLVLLIVLSRLPEHQEWAATVFGPGGSVRSVVVLLSLVLWMPMARVVSGAVRSLRERPFVDAARLHGVRGPSMVVRHLVPNLASVIVINLTITVALAMLTETALSFLGFGVESVTTPTWGNLLTGARSALRTEPHVVWFPALAIVVTVLAVNLVGEGLRRALEPPSSS
jgi:ABC-type dipeptide/oligopeptide/nickel transport system permease subunit